MAGCGRGRVIAHPGRAGFCSPQVKLTVPPQLVEAILQGGQPVELTATRLTELDLPLDWMEQHKLLAS